VRSRETGDQEAAVHGGCDGTGLVEALTGASTELPLSREAKEKRQPLLSLKNSVRSLAGLGRRMVDLRAREGR